MVYSIYIKYTVDTFFLHFFDWQGFYNSKLMQPM